jgi:serine protease Do
LEDVQKAVIQIEAEGTFVDPEFGWEVNAGKRGSGFIIDPSGIAVTNNHVVTGAAILRVWVEGEDKPRNARILGVSECSDLAVIDIEGDGYAYLEWYTGDIKVGLDIYAAGFPLGDPEYTLTKGIVSKASASGETNWASIDYVLEHTAKINPGNSGGPLVDSNGKLIGINYSVVSETDQNYSISREEASSIIEQMRQGKDVDSIGVNGVAVSGNIGDTPIYGVWVRSVESGSPADKSGLESGDIIYQLENEVLATDGTMADYCDVSAVEILTIRWT